jgi:hypothetical protein
VTRQRIRKHRASSAPTRASSRAYSPGLTGPPRSALHTLRRTLLASSRTASLRPLPSCRYTASSRDRSPLPRQHCARPAAMNRASSEHVLRDNTRRTPCLDRPHSPAGGPRYRSVLQTRRPTHRGVTAPAHTDDERQHGHTSEEVCGMKRWSTTRGPLKNIEMFPEGPRADREREPR